VIEPTLKDELMYLDLMVLNNGTQFSDLALTGSHTLVPKYHSLEISHIYALYGKK